MTAEEVRKLFSEFGEIKSVVLFQNSIGQFGFVCYDDPKGVDKEYGPKCAAKAVEALHEKEVGGNKLYLRPALKKAQREQEKKTEALRYKNSKKRCNLYVKNIPSSWTDVELRQVFGKYGEIEQIRVDKS
jgi:polyadenylate-binding protein